MANQQLGDFAAGATVRAFIHTTDLDGAPVTAFGLSAYALKNGSSTEITTGLSATADVGHTGIHRIDLDLASAGFAAGDEGAICYTATVNGVSVRRVEAQFSVSARSSVASLAAIKAKTDNLPSDPADASDIAAAVSAVPAAVLSAASASPVAANVKKVNDVTITGTGVATSDEWRPA